MSELPSHARPSHTITTPRLILRSAKLADAKAHFLLQTEPLNSPFGGVKDSHLSESEQLEKLQKQAASTASGENAWVNVILKPDPEFPPPEAEELRVGDGIMCGMSGFNSFKTDEDGVKVGDCGALIDYRFPRRGFAMEVLQALFEYGFCELGCGKLFLETETVNEPWRALMRELGLGGVEKPGTGEKGDEETVYLFNKKIWEEAKKSLKKRGKWYLEF